MCRAAVLYRSVCAEIHIICTMHLFLKHLDSDDDQWQMTNITIILVLSY